MTNRTTSDKALLSVAAIAAYTSSNRHDRSFNDTTSWQHKVFQYRPLVLSHKLVILLVPHLQKLTPVMELLITTLLIQEEYLH